MKPARSRPTGRLPHGSLLGAFFAVCLPCPAAISYVSNANIPIPTNFGGVFLNLDPDTSGFSSENATEDPALIVDDPASYTVSYSQPNEWDVNFFFGGAAMVHSDTFNPYRAGDGSDNASAIHNLGLGTLIDGSAAGGSQPIDYSNFGGTPVLGGSGAYPADPYMGSGTFEFPNASQGYIGFLLNDGASGPVYGWMEIILRGDGLDGTVVSWAYSDQPIKVGQVPEPAAWLLAVAASLAAWRRRRPTLDEPGNPRHASQLP